VCLLLNFNRSNALSLLGQIFLNLPDGYHVRKPSGKSFIKTKHQNQGATVE